MAPPIMAAGTMAVRLLSTIMMHTITTPAVRIPPIRAKVSPERTPAEGSSKPAVSAISAQAPRAVRFSWVTAIISVPSSAGAIRLSKRVNTQHRARFTISSRHSRTMTEGDRATSRSKSSR